MMLGSIEWVVSHLHLYHGGVVGVRWESKGLVAEVDVPDAAGAVGGGVAAVPSGVPVACVSANASMVQGSREGSRRPVSRS